MIDSTGGHKIADFQFGDKTEVNNACSVLWKSRMFVYGGLWQSNQISEVKGCGLTHIDTLSFNFMSGACANMNDELVFLCFASKEGKLCRADSDPLHFRKWRSQWTTKIDESTYDHYETSIAATTGELITYNFAQFLNKL